ncbi:hypothetical protein WR25_05987 isoform B [Diploscapter pachys]|uniref:Uncharacterized protein n=1 Tax=Diploscapter pachys TaxID=2018661 RepID=A0A2A2LQ94_9BILA|nr:hypothetical protein WR25_05987 isoform B [Diploscapter pachys]
MHSIFLLSLAITVQFCRSFNVPRNLDKRQIDFDEGFLEMQVEPNLPHLESSMQHLSELIAQLEEEEAAQWQRIADQTDATEEKQKEQEQQQQQQQQQKESTPVAPHAASTTPLLDVLHGLVVEAEKLHQEQLKHEQLKTAATKSEVIYQTKTISPATTYSPNTSPSTTTLQVGYI